ncbi:hypothetical protein J4573_33080 [Actinomadura barringtoniae]|uniref:Uncharacterized protein n=1 Tax=Actinomadura barringtoniae TaxID=1427535 RepID=A0A939PFL5_9ACTN|nr:hypothetical protein [Actinomadura barringtoniae]MBO2451962.1 hypothetical protein [Actinomadura barringtoniae]
MLTKALILGISVLPPLPPTTAAHDASLVVYERTGGFAGRNDKVIVDRDGTATVLSAGHLTLTSTELRGLTTDLARITTTWSSSAGCQVADHFTYTISYENWRATRCHEIPADWRPAVDRLDALIDR